MFHHNRAVRRAKLAQFKGRLNKIIEDDLYEAQVSRQNHSPASIRCWEKAGMYRSRADLQRHYYKNEGKRHQLLDPSGCKCDYCTYRYENGRYSAQKRHASQCNELVDLERGEYEDFWFGDWPMAWETTHFGGVHSRHLPLTSEHERYTLTRRIEMPETQDNTNRNKWRGYAEAFTVFAKYSTSSYDHVAGEHDIIYAGPDPSVVSDEDKATLESLGWHIDTSLDSFYRNT
jgi:hypothetical protein